MGFKETLGKMIGIEEDKDETITAEEIEREKAKIKEKEFKPAATPYKAPAQVVSTQQKPHQQKANNLSYNGTSAFKLVVIEPKSFDECPKLVDSLKGRRPVIINLENIETETAKKIFDFLSGATYALNGGVQKVASNIFIFAPESVDIASNNQEDRNFDFAKGNSWAK